MKKLFISMLDSRFFTTCLIVLTLFFMLSLASGAQNVVRKGNTFVEQKSDSAKSGDTKTEYTYTDKKGQVDTVYLSKNGNAYIWKTSKKGNRYKKYLPEVTKQLGTKKEKK